MGARSRLKIEHIGRVKTTLIKWRNRHATCPRADRGALAQMDWPSRQPLGNCSCIALPPASLQSSCVVLHKDVRMPRAQDALERPLDCCFRRSSRPLVPDAVLPHPSLDAYLPRPWGRTPCIHAVALRQRNREMRTMRQRAVANALCAMPHRVGEGDYVTLMTMQSCQRSNHE